MIIKEDSFQESQHWLKGNLCSLQQLSPFLFFFPSSHLFFFSQLSPFRQPRPEVWQQHSPGCTVLCLVAQSCPTLCNPKDCSPSGSSDGNSPGKNTGVGCHALLQGILPTQGLNLVSHTAGRVFTTEPLGKPKNPGVGSLSLLQGNFLTQELNWSLLQCRWTLYQLNSPGYTRTKLNSSM